MRAPPVISAAEWDVMCVLWDAPSPRLAADVVSALAERRDWSPRTVKTLLTRLVKKRAVAFEPRGREYLYRPAVDRDAVVRAESRSFLARVFGGAVGPMLVQFVRQADLSPAEIDQLRHAGAIPIHQRTRHPPGGSPCPTPPRFSPSSGAPAGRPASSHCSCWRCAARCATASPPPGGRACGAWCSCACCCRPCRPARSAFSTCSRPTPRCPPSAGPR